MLDDDLNMVLSDFGLAVKMPRSGMLIGRAGTPCYYPYEMVKSLAYDYRADLWCVGVLLVEMLFGVLPFKAKEPTRDYSESIIALTYSLPKAKGSTVSAEAKDLIEKLLVRQEDRLSLPSLENHPWLQKTFPNSLKLNFVDHN